ncbi:hypothetical protein [Alkalitalea saponilacus]|uniref:Cellobiose phosphorylase n=1 Tax=Alkalitalea saponilacus TaxID=889453 RepID=A0A1T5DY92_9BACT|nr:hypothetical protein [Alkalitalea saponilacus]ASB49148.1 hypothetical protein CDL62_08335 [Alkalitalea saponilacus]SKB76802.1 hypothetical protein SAMN03080601_01165 [Alkalitalea saponilacus]
MTAEKNKKVEMEVVDHNGERYFKINNHNAMRHFFMSIVSDSNHWMYISSNGGLSAGRKNPEYALFPYYTDDKITESADTTGSKTIFQVEIDGEKQVLEPFSERFTNKYNISRNIYKSIYGNKIIFEEINHDIGLTFRYQWSSSKRFGFVRRSEIINNSSKPCRINVLDGIQNVMPYGVPSDLQRSTSNLVDAYKRSELERESGIGIFALSAIIVDRAEPSEALKANIVWSIGLDQVTHLLSSAQLDKFRNFGKIIGESDVKGERGAYFVSSEISLSANSSKEWVIVAEVNQNHSQVVRLKETIKSDTDLMQQILVDVESGTQNLIKLVASADGLQNTGDKLKDTRHFSNVMFNIMRGGIFDNNYEIKKSDFVNYLSKANKKAVEENQDFIQNLAETFTHTELKESLETINDVDLIRLSIEYLPLKFSRRHGDPSRPWNYFTINIQDETDGSEILDYEGNWRDIFQNWEALAHSYPDFIEGMIFKFLNASTFDGYNPYRVTKDGFDWETIEPDNPWSYIGYWGDHQIIYLQKFFEFIEKYHPGKIHSLFDREWFVYAAVPYIIKPHSQIMKNPKDTIEFDHNWDQAIREQRDKIGADGALLTTQNRNVYHVNFIEKILATVLAKVSNFIPETGIWLNTQRPEWNDANNALVGNGVSMVTLYYLHRFLTFFQKTLEGSKFDEVEISAELAEFLKSIGETLDKYSHLLSGKINDQERKEILDSLGTAASMYRETIYQNGFSGKKVSLLLQNLKRFTKVTIDYLQHSIRANQREDKLYHAYNLMTATESGVSCSYLSEMLEGQVAVLSAGYLNSTEVLELLDSLKSSALFREDQYSYILYPNKNLPGFLQKNTIPATDAASSELIKELVKKGNKAIVEQDVMGEIHFNGNFKNADDVKVSLESLNDDGLKDLAVKEKELVLEIFEKVFNHKAFTGRSGTFYGYEGLGSIYWHMVSKLHLAVQECCLQAIEEKADEKIIGRLTDHYYEIGAGIGVHKSPELYGAFPTDPYSHTPKHRGAQQPGMTGQVKEDILVRFSEIGVFVDDGQLQFNPVLLVKDEFLSEENTFTYLTVTGEERQIQLKEGELAFTYCTVPVIYSQTGNSNIMIYYSNGEKEEVKNNILSRSISSLIFKRTGKIERLEVSF